jgi:hypothetical protein
MPAIHARAGAGKQVASTVRMSPKPAPRKDDASTPAEQHTGISNRETPREEDAERHEHPPIDPGPPPPEDAAGRVGDAETATFEGAQTSHKAGSRAVAQKEDETRYPDRSMPPSRKVSGAFGKEPHD